jgi:hypothetical protein
MGRMCMVNHDQQVSTLGSRQADMPVSESTGHASVHLTMRLLLP